MIASESYRYLLEYFGEEKIKNRYIFLAELMEKFIRQENMEEHVYVNGAILEQVILDYFADIHRLKDFHNIVKVNTDKITAYTIHWALRRKPIQACKKESEAIKFINERFVLSYLRMYLFGEDYATLVSSGKPRYEHDNFFKNFLYAMKYRYVDAQILELLIITYRAGRAFQYSVDFARSESPPLIQEAELELPPEDDSSQIH